MTDRSGWKEILYHTELRAGDYVEARFKGHWVEGEAYKGPSGHLALGNALIVDSEGDLFPDWFIVRIQREPLTLPIQPTWGIVVFGTEDVYLSIPRQYVVRGDWLYGKGFNGGTENISVPTIRKFIPFTDEQIAEIEAER